MSGRQDPDDDEIPIVASTPASTDELTEVSSLTTNSVARRSESVQSSNGEGKAVARDVGQLQEVTDSHRKTRVSTNVDSADSNGWMDAKDAAEIASVTEPRGADVTRGSSQFFSPSSPSPSQTSSKERSSGKSRTSRSRVTTTSPGAVAVPGMRTVARTLSDVVADQSSSTAAVLGDGEESMAGGLQSPEIPGVTRRIPLVAQLVPNEDEIDERIERQVSQRVKVELQNRLEDEPLNQVNVSAIPIDEETPVLRVESEEKGEPVTSCASRRVFWIVIAVMVIFAATGTGVGLALKDDGEESGPLQEML